MPRDLDGSRTDVLDVAKRVFERRGYHDTTLTAIASEAGISTDELRTTYPDSDELILAVIADRYDRQIARMRSSFGGEGDLTTQIIAIALGFFESVAREEDWSRAFHEFRAYSLRRPELRRRLETIHRRLAHGIAELLGARLETRAPGIDAELLALAALAVAHGFSLERLVIPGAIPDELFGQCMAALTIALSNSATPSEHETSSSGRPAITHLDAATAAGAESAG